MSTRVAQFRLPAAVKSHCGAVAWWQGLLALMVAAVFMLGACKRENPAPPAAASQPVHLAPLPKPIGPLPAKTSCVTGQCHENFQTAAHIHGPVAQDSCNSCHQGDQGGHHYPLIRQGNAICTFCHVVSGTKTHQHKAVDLMAQPGASGIGGCLNCHDPHVSKAKFLLAADNVEALCSKCHSLPLKKHAHEPFAAGQCTVCHQPHESDYASLLRNGQGPEHCFGCHKDKREAMTLPFVHKASEQSCTTCHGPHATDYPKQLKRPVNETCLDCHFQIKAEIAKAKYVHGALVAGNCASCHDPHASSQPDELKARTDKVCMTCHEKAIQVGEGREARTIQAMGPVLASKNLHGPVKSGSCSECHQPHAADQPNLLKQYFPDTFYTSFDVKKYALCFSCHDQELVLKKQTTNLTNFRDGNLNLHFVHVNREDKGRTCITCHDVHGSDLPRHMASSVPFEGSAWSMPINYEETASGGSCTPACHAERTYDRNKPAATMPAERGVR